MYLKYTPASSVRSNAVVRDIARAVTSSSVGSNEFDSGVASENVIEGNTSHGWTLDSRDTFSTDATPGVNDQKYRIYNTTAASGIKKALSLKQNGNHTNSTMYNSTYGSGGGIGLFPLMAYEAAEELECWGYAGTNNSYYYHNTMNKATSGFNTIHIFAGPKYFIMAGWDYSTDVILQGYVEVDKTSMHHRWESITGRTSPSAVFFTISGSADDGIGHCYYGEGNGSSGHSANWINLPEMTVMGALNKAYKNVYFGGAYWAQAWPNYYYDSYASIDDGTSTGTTSGLTNNYDYANSGKHLVDNTGMWNWLDASRGDYLENYPNSLGKNNYYQDASGTKHVPLWPMVIDASFYMSGVTMNISKYCPIYFSLPGQGAMGDTMTVGSDKYVYLGDNTTGRQFGFFIKVE